MSFHIKIACVKINMQQNQFNYRQDFNDIVHRPLTSSVPTLILGPPELGISILETPKWQCTLKEESLFC